jgi:hypothetical protein
MDIYFNLIRLITHYILLPILFISWSRKANGRIQIICLFLGFWLSNFLLTWSVNRDKFLHSNAEYSNYDIDFSKSLSSSFETILDIVMFKGVWVEESPIVSYMYWLLIGLSLIAVLAATRTIVIISAVFTASILWWICTLATFST